MRKNYKILFYFYCIVLLFACGSNDDNDDCSNVFPAPNWFELGFFDSQGQALIGSVYEQDEFRVFNSNNEVFLSPIIDNPTRLQVRFNDFTSNLDYYIELTAIDIDTLRFVYETNQGPCFLNYNLQQVVFNGETIPAQNSYWVDLIK